MKQLVADMRAIENGIEQICEKMMQWENKNLFGDIQEMMTPMTTLLSIVFNNKEFLGQLGLDIREAEITTCLNEMMNGLEKRDEIELLESFYYGYLPWLHKLADEMEQILKQQED